MGDLVPVLCKKVIAGDRWKVGLSSITRLAPLANPVYDRVRITYDAFFVQNRIIDPDYKDFISPEPDSTNPINTGMYIYTAYQKNNACFSLFRRGGLMDFLGFQFSDYLGDGGAPWGNGTFFKINAVPLFGYYKIWDTWYRNERTQNKVYDFLMNTYNKSTRTVDLQFGVSVDFNEYGFLPVNYGKDLYTTALPEPLIGGPVNIPAGNSQVGLNLVYTSGKIQVPLTGQSSSENGPIEIYPTDSAPDGGWPKTYLGVDMKNAVLGTIQELKFAYALFGFFMKDTYNGNRYVEFMQAHYGVRVPDSTLERPLFLGRQTQWINFSEIFQTSGSTADANALGDYAGVGSATGNGFLFDKEFDENGFLYIMMSIRPNTTYFQGVNPHWYFGERFDEFYFPEFQNIGDKPIYSIQLYYDGKDNSSIYADFSYSSLKNTTIFGYNRANSEYIWFPDEMHGNFLNPVGEMNWTFARKFTSKPVIGSTFSRVPPIQSPFTFTDSASLNYYTDILFRITALRPVVRNEHY